jgi:hypothetical protein
MRQGQEDEALIDATFTAASTELLAITATHTIFQSHEPYVITQKRPRRVFHVVAALEVVLENLLILHCCLASA